MSIFEVIGIVCSVAFILAVLGTFALFLGAAVIDWIDAKSRSR